MRKPDLAAEQLQRAEASLLELNLRPDPAAPDTGVRIARVDGVVCLAVPAAPVPYVNRALGFGTLAAATPRLLARVIAQYDALGRETRISVATGHTPEAAVRLLAEAGFIPDPEMPRQLIYLQQALLAERIRIGFDRGATRYFAFTENPASARNMEALGFRKVYDQVSWVRPRTSGVG